MRHHGRHILCASVAIAAALVEQRPASAQNAVTMADSVVPFAAGVAVVGAADPAAPVSFQVALRLRNRTELDQRLLRHERVSAAQLAAEHWPTPAQYAAVRTWLTDQGLTIDRDTDDRLMIEAHGTSAQVSRALGVGFSRVESEGRAFVATADTPRLPPSIAADVASINGLQPYQHMNPLGVPSSAAPHAAQGSPAITISGNYYPAGILRAYQALPYLTQTGAGTRTAILIDTLPNKSDLTAFYKLIGSAQSLANIEFVKVAAGTLPAPSGEESLDTEWASGMAYQSKVRVYAAGSLQFTALDTGFHKIISDLAAGVAIDQLSISLGACEETISRSQIDTDNTLLENITAQGVSIMVSTGDSGAHECGAGSAGLHPAFYSTSPYVTAVGGTSLIVTAASNTAPKVTIKSETAWSDSGGGISKVFAKPSYQSKLSYAGRAVPDVAAVGDPNTGVDIVLDGSTEEVGGTSASTPIWAGLMALVNQARAGSGLSTLGALNARLYPLLLTGNFRDVISGNNGYPAGKGYDLTTGLGSPIMKTLLPTLVSQP